MSDFAFRSIAENLRHDIIAGTYPVGGSLPSERELSERFGVSLGTARAALKELMTEGIADGGRGRPKTVVRQPKRAGSFDEFHSFAQWAMHLGRRPGGLVAQSQWRIASDDDIDYLEVDPGSRVLEVQRIRTLDGDRVLLEWTHYPEWLGETIQLLPPDAASVTALLAEEHGVHFSHAEHLFGAAAADPEQARDLEVTVGSPLLVHRRISRDGAGTVLEWSIDHYVAGKVMLSAGSSWRFTPLQWTFPSPGAREPVETDRSETAGANPDPINSDQANPDQLERG